ncbi:hypothetical protein ES708_32850 [subsurface metagenome]
MSPGENLSLESLVRVPAWIIYSAGRSQESLTADQHSPTGENQLLSGGKPAATIPRSGISVLTGSRIGIKARYSGKVYSVARLEERPKVKSYVKVVTDKRALPTKPIANHPWKSGRSGGSRYDPRDEELALGLFNSTIAWETDNY